MPNACCRCSSLFNLRWLEEPVIPDDIHGYAELKSYGRIPIAGGASMSLRFTAFAICWKPALSTTSSSIPTGSEASRRKLARIAAALAEAHSVPAHPLTLGRLHNFHGVVMASLNSPMAEYFPVVDVEASAMSCSEVLSSTENPRAKDGFIDLLATKIFLAWD